MNYLPRKNEWVIGLIKSGSYEFWTEVSYCGNNVENEDVWCFKDPRRGFVLGDDKVIDWIPKPVRNNNET